MVLYVYRENHKLRVLKRVRFPFYLLWSTFVTGVTHNGTGTTQNAYASNKKENSM